ncbi:hypothetical protein Hanom_Chr04g00310651 [Helianthus anomalus]
MKHVGTLYVDATRLGSIRFGSTRLGPTQARRHDIPPSCAPEFDMRSTESREQIPFTHHHDIIMMMSQVDQSLEF